MRADLDAVAHAEQDQPGKEDAGEFKRSAPAGIEAVAGDDLGEGHQGDGGHQDGEEVFLKCGDRARKALLDEKESNHDGGQNEYRQR